MGIWNNAMIWLSDHQTIASQCATPNAQSNLYRISFTAFSRKVVGDLPAVSNKIASRRLQLAGHCYRHPELSTQKLVLWEPTHGHRGRGRPITTYIDTLKRDTGAFEASEIAVLMADKRLWKDLVVAHLRATKLVCEWVVGKNVHST